MDLIENKNFLTEEELEEIKVLETNEFPWFFNKSSGDYNTKYNEIGADVGSQFFSHSIIPRYDYGVEPIINSDYYTFFNNIFERFCEKNGIKYKRILRMCLNLTYYTDKEFFVYSHVDHPFPNRTTIMYLNKSSGNTVLYKNKFIENSSQNTGIPNDSKELEIDKEVTPELGKILSFDGLTYHTNRPCNVNENRIICVVTCE